MPLEKDASIYIVKLRDICGVSASLWKSEHPEVSQPHLLGGASSWCRGELRSKVGWRHSNDS